MKRKHASKTIVNLFSNKKAKPTPIIFDYGDVLMDTFISFCPPYTRLMLLKLYPTEHIIFKEFQAVFILEDMYFGIYGDELYVSEEHNAISMAPIIASKNNFV